MTSALQGFATIPRYVLEDESLPTDAKMVYLVLSSHVGSNETAWPSHAKIAKIAGISLAQVKRMLPKLRDKNLISWTLRPDPSNPQRMLSNEYRLISGSASTQQTESVPPDPRSHRPQVTQTPGQGERGVGSPGARERESLNENQLKTLDQLPKNATAEFDQFWDIYPRRQGKANARKAFERASKQFGVEVITAGAERFASDPNLPEPQFIPHPATWLNQGRWADDPLPPRRDTGRKRNGDDKVADGIALVRRLAEQRDNHQSQIGA